MPVRLVRSPHPPAGGSALFALLALAAALLALPACTGPDRLLQAADVDGSRDGFEKIIERFPESQEAEIARTRLVELSRWEEVSASQDEGIYQSFIDDFQTGLFAGEARDRIADLREYGPVRAADTIDEYERHLEAQSAIWLSSRAEARIAELTPTAARYASIRPDDENEEDLQRLAEEFAETGYARLLWHRVEQLAVERVVESQLASDTYLSLRDHLSDLDAYLAVAPEGVTRDLAKQAREDRLIEQVQVSFGWRRFVLPGVKVHAASSGHRFSVSATPLPRSLGPDGQLTLNFSGGMEKAPPNDTLVFTEGAAGISSVLFTDYPDDSVPVRFSEGLIRFADGGERFVAGQGAVQIPTLTALHTAAGSESYRDLRRLDSLNQATLACS